ncbi:MAG: flavocytochrome c [Deltaproteobacteria bacterium]|nr:flavocytochrome c [Deltaproteobacteria bacterium]
MLTRNAAAKEGGIFESQVPKWDEIADVVIIGSGFAGLTAAIEACNAGASVLILEKMKAPGGNSIISDGGIAAAGTRMQEKAGIKDSPELMCSDMLKAGLGLNYPELVREVAERSNEVFQWSIDYLGVEYLDRVDRFGGHSVPRCYTARNVTGLTIIKRQLATMKQLGMEIRTQMHLRKFIRNSEGRVCGVLVRDGYDHRDADSGSDRYIQARKAVVLATGGFGSDVAFRVAQDPRLSAEIDTTNKPFATAEGLKEAMKIGAMPVHLSQIQLGPWASPDEKGFGVGPGFSDYIVFLYGIVIDPGTGRRFVNELADRKTLSDAILNIGRPCIGIADAQAVERSGWSIDRCLKKGVVKEFDGLRELASFYGLPHSGLKPAIEEYNGFVVKGQDETFGKQILPDAATITHPPYYGMRLWPKVHHTMGGVRIDVRGQVIDLDQNPVRGVYAAGEVTGGIHGACRLGSCAITDCFVFGRIAGRNAAAESA